MSIPRPRRATLSDVADMAGVSRQTVSRVVNGSPHVSNKVRRRVLQIIKELDYRPNQFARSLKGKQSFVLQAIVACIGYYGQPQLVESVERAARAHGYKLMFSNLEVTDPDQAQMVLDNLQSQTVDGVIVFGFVQSDYFDALLQACQGFPYVQVNSQPGSQAPSVSTDQYYGGQLAAQYLIDLGHREIAEISGPFAWHSSSARHKAWLDTLQANGLTPGQSVEGAWTAASGYEAMQCLLDGNAMFSAVFVGNDQMALGAMASLQESGLRIPADVSVVGFDDIPEAAYFRPALTTIREDYTVLGKQSVEYLLEIIKDPETPLHQRILYPTLVERKSVRALR